MRRAALGLLFCSHPFARARSGDDSITRPWSLAQPESGNFYLKPPILGMVIFADSVGEVDEASAIQMEFGNAGSEVPTDGLDRRECCGEWLG